MAQRRKPKKSEAIGFARARDIAKRYIDACGPDNKIIDGRIVEHPYGWHFEWRPGDRMFGSDFSDITLFVVDVLFSCPPLIVERETGTPYLLPMSCRFGLEKYAALKDAYEAGFRYQLSDLIIHEVFNIGDTVDFLYELHLADVSADNTGSDSWKPPEYYTREELKDLLKHLPCTFSGFNFFWSYPVFSRYDQTGCCMYSLKAKDGGRVK